ncbi:MAG: hypothetical protein DRN03_04340 [Thermoplasmata archaeon]|nr:MAG: hypothetical protein DRN03_04340 [Thermoplasmata archaeon]
MRDLPIPVVKNPKLHEPSDYERMKGGFYEAGKWSTFLHLLVAPIVAKYGFGKIRDPYSRENFIKRLKEALSRVKIKDVKAYTHGYTPNRIDDLKDGFLIPPLEEVLQDPEKRDEFVGWLKVALREIGIRTYKEEINKMIDRVYPLAVKIHDKFVSRWGGFDRWGNPITTITKEEVKKWEEFEEYLKILEEFAGLKRKVKHPTPTRTMTKTPVGVAPQSKRGPKSTILEILSAFQALKYLSYSEEALKNAVKDLEAKMEAIEEKEEPSPEDVYTLGLYHLALAYIKKGKFEKAEDVFKKL